MYSSTELSRHAATVGSKHQVKGDAAPNLGRKVVQAGAPRQSLVAMHVMLGVRGGVHWFPHQVVTQQH